MDGESLGKGLRSAFNNLILTGAISFVALGTVGYFGARHYERNRQTIRQMEWVADHNEVYGNKNGKFDLEEKVAVINELGKTYGADQKISLADAKTYLESYARCSIAK